MKDNEKFWENFCFYGKIGLAISAIALIIIFKAPIMAMATPMC